MRLVRRGDSTLQACARHQSIIHAFGRRASAGKNVQSLMESAAIVMAGALGGAYSKPCSSQNTPM